MTDADKLARIRELMRALPAWGSPEQLNSANRKALGEIRVILRPSAAPVEPSGEFDDDHEALNERNPVDDDDEPSTPEADPVGTVRVLNHHVYVKLTRPASEPWHIAYSDGPQRYSGWQDNESMANAPVVGYVPISECYEPAAHGHVVEHREDLGPVLRRCEHDDFPIRDEAKGCPRCNASPVVEHQPAQDSGGDPNAWMDLLCGKYVPGTSSNRCLLWTGHSGDCDDDPPAAVTERDLALWLHAEAKWQLSQATVEWGYKAPWGQVYPSRTEADARNSLRYTPSARLVQRRVTPWVEDRS